MTTRTILKAGALAAAVVLALPGAAAAQQHVTIVVPFAAGGTSDISMRALATKVEDMGGPKFVIENRPGGGGVTAALAVRDAAPDGRTLFLANYATFTVNRAMAQNFPLDPIADFKPITTLFSFPLMFVVPSKLEAKSVADFVALSKKKSGGLTYGSQGVGTAGHLLGELFGSASKASLVHVPYKGAAQGVLDLVAARLDLMFIGVLPTKQHFEAGTLKALAVASRTRMKAVPDAPTMAEVGYPDVNTDFVWFGLVGPAKMPDSVAKDLNERFAKAAAQKDLQDKLDVQGVIVGTGTPAEFTNRMKSDYEKFAPIVKASGAKK